SNAASRLRNLSPESKSFSPHIHVYPCSSAAEKLVLREINLARLLQFLLRMQPVRSLNGRGHHIYHAVDVGGIVLVSVVGGRLFLLAFEDWIEQFKLADGKLPLPVGRNPLVIRHAAIQVSMALPHK